MKRQLTHMTLLPSTVAAFSLYAATAQAQDSPPPAPPAVDIPEETPTEAPGTPAVAAEEMTPPAPSATEEIATGETPALPGEEAPSEVPAEQEELEDGMRLNDAALNTVFEVLARDAGLSYFHNNRIAGEDFKVNGYLRDGDPLEQMEDLAFNNALTLHRKGNTIYALTSDQLNQLPATEWTYQLRYLRSENMKEHIRELVSPLLSPNTGIVNYEEKTNTLIVIDTPYKIQRVQSLLERVDKAKGQIVVEVKILSVQDASNQDTGFDWTRDFGGGNSQARLAVSNLLGLPVANSTTLAGAAPITDLVFTPSEISAVLRALNTNNLTKLKNNPVLITEDNETANISIIDRIPIITTEFSGTGDSVQVTEEVRYKIDEEDSVDPEDTREIGTTISVTPTLLPDGTIRLQMRPRNASVVGQVAGTEINGNRNNFPRVTESTVTTTARIPNGHSLVIGGFYKEETEETHNKVPLLGDIPGVSFFFKNKGSETVKSNLIFVITPTSYDPATHSSQHRTHNRLMGKLNIKTDKTVFEHKANKGLHKPNLKRALKNIRKETAIDHALEPTKRSNKNNRYRVHR